MCGCQKARTLGSLDDTGDWDFAAIRCLHHGVIGHRDFTGEPADPVEDCLMCMYPVGSACELNGMLDNALVVTEVSAVHLTLRRVQPVDQRDVPF